MSGVIKQHVAASRIGVFDGVIAQPAPEPSRPDPNITIIAALEGELAELENRLFRQADEAVAAIDAARTAGHQAGLAAAADREEERVAAVCNGIAAAHARLDDTLDVIEGLAPLLARRALARLFDPADELGDRAAAMLSRQLRDLRDAVVQSVRVSGADHAAIMAHPVRAMIPAGAELVADDMLASGECRIILRLGAIDLSVREQWDMVAATLDAMARP